MFWICNNTYAPKVATFTIMSLPWLTVGYFMLNPYPKIRICHEVVNEFRNLADREDPES
jgi:hypothetical protein